MKVIVVEDEKHARENLETLLLEIDSSIEIQAKLESVKRTVEWLQNNETELIFLDIHLADALSFEIFEQVKVSTPIIFTTAYDKYALKAFKVNSIDYLLKPIDKEELAQSIAQFQALPQASTFNYEELRNLVQAEKKDYQKRFIVSRGPRIMSVKLDKIAYFEGEDRYVYLTKTDGVRYIIDYKLGDLEELLDPKVFFRLNRSFIANFDSIQSITTMSKSRFKVDLQPAANRDIFVSSVNAKHFKAWLNQ